MKNVGYNAGFVAWAGREASEHTYVLEILLKAGCVFQARTTEPQTLVSNERAGP